MKQSTSIIREAPPVRPWLGFGRWGWAALVVLAGLVTAAVAGWDPYILTLHGVARFFGHEAVPWYAIFAATYPRLALSSIQCSAITAVAGTVALWMTPGRFSWLRLAVLWVGCIALSSFGMLLYSDWIRPWFSWGEVRHAMQVTYPAIAVSILLISAAVIGVGTGSRLTAVVAVIAGAIGIAWDEYAIATGRPIPPVSTGLAWQIIVAATLLADGLRRRRRAPAGESPWCARCLHSLRGNASTRCPECGADLAVVQDS